MRRTQMPSAVRFVQALVLPGLAILAGPGLARDGQEGTVWSFSWDTIDADALAAFKNQSILLTHILKMWLNILHCQMT